MKQTITKLALTVLSLGVLACSDSDDTPGPNGEAPPNRRN